MVDEDPGAELARLREAEAKRKSRNKVIGGVVAGVVLLGGAVYAGTQLAGGGDEATPEPTQPAAEAPANPDEVEAPVDNTAPEPIVDIPAEPETPVEVGISVPVDFESMSNEEIIEKYTLDLDFVNAQGSSWVIEQAHSFGVETPLIDAQLLWDTTQNDPFAQEGRVPQTYDTGEGWERFYAPLENNLEVVLNMMSANSDIINQTDTAESGIIMRGLMTDIVRGQEQMINKEIDPFDVRDQSVARNMLEIVNQYPEGTVFTDVYVAVNTNTSGDNDDYGTNISYSYRTPDSSNFESVSPLRLADKPVQQYNLEERTITKAGPEQEVVWLEENLWDPYDPASTEAKTLIPRD